MWGLLTRDGIEGMGEAVGDWPGMFKELNLGTTATLTLLRGIFCEKQHFFFPVIQQDRLKNNSAS